MTERAGPDHPGWAIWERVRRENREGVEQAVRDTAAWGLPPPPPYQPLPEDPGREHLDLLVQMEAEEEARARTFLYWAISWDGGPPSVTAERDATGPQSGAVTFDGWLSGTWIFDPRGLGEVRHQIDTEDHYSMELVSRAEAERIAAMRGLTLPSEERLLEICEQRIGAMFGLSATMEELKERKRLMP